MKNLFSILLLLFTFNLYAQSNRTLKDAKEIHFYGYDFTQFKLVNPKKMNDILINYAFGISDYINKKISKRKIFERNMKTSLLYKNNANQRNRDLSPYSFSAGAAPDPISKKMCLKILSEYNYKETKGVGLIILMEYADKQNEATRIRPIFFDIKTRNIIYSQPIISKNAKGTGFTRHWGGSFIKSMKVLSQINYNESSGWYTKIYEDPCGIEPQEPKSFNSASGKHNFKESAIYKKYKRKYNAWKDCKGL